eukprot:g8729.t1
MRVFLVILALGALIQAAVAEPGLRANIPIEKALKKCDKFDDNAAKKRKCVKFIKDKFHDQEEEEEKVWTVKEPKKKWNRKQFERGVRGCRIGLENEENLCNCAEVAEKACAERPEKFTDHGHLDRKLLKSQCEEVRPYYDRDGVPVEFGRGEAGLRIILKLCKNEEKTDNKACFSYLSAAAGCEKELKRNRE